VKTQSRSIERDAILRVATAGSVDDGKSTLIGRLLYDSDSICDDHLKGLRVKGLEGSESLALALLTDGLKSEREQQITIDVAYRYFSTKKRHYVLADAPGHEQYTRNMVTASSNADVLIVLVDATQGILTQTKRHSFIGALMGVPRLLVVVNKMDLVGYDQARFEKIKSDYLDFASKLQVKDIRLTPISALCGDNVVNRSKQMPWYKGETVLEYLENVYIGGDKNLIDFRFPVQYVLRPNAEFRGYAGQIVSGSVREGDSILVLPTKTHAKVRRVSIADKSCSLAPQSEAAFPQSVVIELDRQVDVARGDMIVREANTPRAAKQFEAVLVWMGDTALDPSKTYLLRHTSREVKASLRELRYGIDINTLHRKEAKVIGKNEVFSAYISTFLPIFVDDYRINRGTGSFILVDPEDFFTVAAGMIVEKAHTDGAVLEAEIKKNTQNLHFEAGLISRKARESNFGYSAVSLWLTGLSGSGKSTISREIEARLFSRGMPIYRIDGDNLRSGLNKNLGFSKDDRAENIRRAAEVASLLNDAGVSVICSLISPFEDDRNIAKQIIGADNFLEIYVEASIETCEKRDPHGLYKKARKGEIKEFTGISSPYEKPQNPWLVANTEEDTADLIASRIVERILERVQLG